MRKQIPIHTYTQINTVEDSFLIQNLSHDALLIVVADTQPADNADHDFIIENRHAISNDLVVGLCWGKPEGKTALTVGYTEG